MDTKALNEEKTLETLTMLKSMASRLQEIATKLAELERQMRSESDREI